MTILKYLFNLFVFGALIFGCFRLSKRGPLPVAFKTADELEAITHVVLWAKKQIGPDDPRWTPIFLMDSYLVNYGINLTILTRISRQDLEILAPFIDQFIEGKGPPSMLSAEYEDWRPAALRDFKARMKAERLWPMGAA
jgi:hypothetical protein